MNKRVNKRVSCKLSDMKEIRSFNNGIMFGLLDGGWRVITYIDNLYDYTEFVDCDVELSEKTQKVTIEEARKIANHQNEEYRRVIFALNDASEGLYMNAYEAAKAITNDESRKLVYDVIDKIWNHPFSKIKKLR